LVDLAGAIVELYSFDAYGNAIGFDPSVALTEFLYSGEQFDSKIGQQYLRARYYDPATGRFNRLDPFFGNLNDPQSLHKYLYTHADPVNGIDPSGEMTISMAINIAIRAVTPYVAAAMRVLSFVVPRLSYYANMSAYWFFTNTVTIELYFNIGVLGLLFLDGACEAIIRNTEPVIPINNNEVGGFVEKKANANAVAYQGIDDIRPGSSEGKVHVTSIKSNSQNMDKLTYKVDKWAQDLSTNRNFKPKNEFSGQIPVIQSSQIESKSLLVVIPQNHSAYLTNTKFLQAINQIARSTQVAIRVVPLTGWIRKK
jgi:RHS repeat-associated protein